MTRSTRSSSSSSRSTSSWASMSAAQPLGRSAVASTIVSYRTRFDSLASLPPLRTTALPDFNASAAIWTKASGRDSKTVATTPIGTDTRYSSRSTSSSRAASVSPRGSNCAATDSTIDAIDSIFVSSSFSRSTSARVYSPSASSSSAASTSSVFASSISSSRSRIASAIDRSASFRVASSTFARRRAARSAERASSSVPRSRSVSVSLIIVTHLGHE